MCYSFDRHVFLINYVFSWHWYKKHTLVNSKQTLTKYTFTYICNNLFRTSHLYLPGKTKPSCQDLTSDVPGMGCGLTLVHVHANTKASLEYIFCHKNNSQMLILNIAIVQVPVLGYNSKFDPHCWDFMWILKL